MQLVHVAGLMRRLAWAAADIAVPPGCLGCGIRTSEQGTLCARCCIGMHFIERPYCDVLGRPFGYDHGPGAVSPEAMADPPPFDRLRSAVVYNDQARALVSGLKFGDRGELAPWMARWMAIAGRELVSECDMIVPIPLHWRRLFVRRYNQSAELARHVSKLTGKTYAPLVVRRIKRTRRQIGLTATERLRNVEGAFRVPAQARPLVTGRHVLLIDDVYTSGATAKACTRALKRAGAAKVDVLTFASVPDGNI